MAVRVISYCTPRYADMLDRRLVPSCRRLRVPIMVHRVQRELPSWEAAARYKATVIRSAYAETRDDLLWVDADAELHADPRPYLEGRDCDVAAGYLGAELLSGTLWLPAGRPALAAALRAWEQANAATRGRCDQLNLQRILEKRATLGELRLSVLPPAYCFICDTHRRMFPDVAPVIEHHQASRTFRPVNREV